MSDTTLFSVSWDDPSWELLQEAIDRLSRAWKSGSEPVLADFVPVASDDPRFAKMLLYLIEADHECRRGKGLEKGAGEYVAEFPALEDMPEMMPAIEDVLRVEDAAPSGSGSSMSWARPEHLRVLCPECGQLVDVSEEDVAGTKVCPECKESFRPSDAGVPTETSPADEVRARRRVAHFELIEQLGVGAFGSVWKAWDMQLKRPVALKLPRAGRAGFDAARFLREAETAARLDHPSIVSVYGAGREGGVVYIVNSLVEGENLRAWRKNRDLSACAIAELCATTAAALHYAHERGVVHRDVKPENILIDGDGKPHVTDFGLAKVTDGSATVTRAGDFMGSPWYMPPEQAKGDSHKADRRSDVYSLGVVLYELLAGVVPFHERNIPVLVKMIEEDEPPSVRSANTRISRDLETICLKCLEKDPANRYQSAAELADDLRRFLAGKPILARPVGFCGRTWRWCRRQPVVATLVAATFVGVVVAAYYVIESRRLADVAEANRSIARTSTRQAEESTQWARATVEKAKTESEEETTRRDQAERRLYHTEIGEAWGRWHAGDCGGAQGSLDQCAERLRGWEWHYINRLCRPELLTLEGHDDEVTSVTYSPDGRKIASGSLDATIRIWGASTGDQITAWRERSSIFSIAFSPDGKRIAAATRAGTIEVRDAVTGEKVQTLSGHAGVVQCLAFSPNGRRIASAGKDSTIRIWNAADGAELHVLQRHRKAVSCIAFSPDGRMLASAGRDRTIRLWDVAAGSESRLIQVGGGQRTTCLAFTPDGAKLLSGSSSGKMALWSVESGESLGALNPRGFGDGVTDLALSPRTDQIVTANKDRSIILWDLQTMKRLHRCRSHTEPVSCVAFSPDGKRLVSGGNDKTVKVFDASLHAATSGFKASGAVRTVVFSPDGRRIAAAGAAETIKVWDVESGEETATIDTGTDIVSDIAFYPDGRKLAVANHERTIRVFGVDSSERVLTIQGHDSPFTSVAVHPDGRMLASASADCAITLWNADTGEELRTINDGSENVDRIARRPIAFSADGLRVIGDAGRGEVRIWHVPTGRVLHNLDRAGGACVSTVAISPDGGRAFSAKGPTMAVWNAVTGANLRVLSCPTEIHDAVFSPDGRRIITGSRGLVTIWDGESGEKLIEILRFDPTSYKTTAATAHTTVRAVAFSPDGNRIAAGESDGAVAIFNGTPMNETCVVVGPDPIQYGSSKGSERERFVLDGHDGTVSSVTVSPDGGRIVSGGADGKIKEWDAATGEGICVYGDGIAIHCMAISHDGRRIALGNRDGNIQIRNSDEGKEIRSMHAHSRPVSGIAFSPGGERIASCSRDETVKVWDAGSGECLHTLRGHERGIYCIAFSPDGRHLVSGGNDKTIRIWDVASGKQLRIFKDPGGHVVCVAFSPDGKRLVSGNGGHEVIVWDAATGDALLSLRGHWDRLKCVAYSPNGSRIASGSKDRKIKIWDSRTGKELLTLEGHKHDVQSVAFTPDGSRVVSGSDDHTVRIWDVTEHNSTGEPQP